MFTKQNDYRHVMFTRQKQNKKFTDTSCLQNRFTDTVCLQKKTKFTDTLRLLNKTESLQMSYLQNQTESLQTRCLQNKRNETKHFKKNLYKRKPTNTTGI